MNRARPNLESLENRWLLSAESSIVINEIHYNSTDNTKRLEYVELLNIGSESVDLAGWALSDGVRYVFPQSDESKVAPGSRLVVGEDPEALREEFGVAAVGPWAGRLSNEDDRIVLLSRNGEVMDQVHYQATFPWPVAANGQGYSMELIHPQLDNDLGGSWRSSYVHVGGPVSPTPLIAKASSDWSYYRGIAEPSQPMTAWTQPGYTPGDDWFAGQTPIGYGDGDDNTQLDDMRRNYSTVYLRHPFDIAPGQLSTTLTLKTYVDDGAVVWINGVEVARMRLPEGDVPFDAITFPQSHEAAWETFVLLDADAYLVEGRNVVAVQAANFKLTDVDLSVDLELWAGGFAVRGGPTPGSTNHVFSDNAPPQTRQVRHTPQMPRPDEVTLVSAKVTDPDGVAGVELQYQLVLPGAYLPARLPVDHAELERNPDLAPVPNPEYEDPTTWTSVAMRDDGTDGDAVAGDNVYSARIPPQQHRTLVRYRLNVEDLLGAEVQLPYADDPSLNFALFVYDGVPDYLDTAAAGLTSIPVYHLLTRAEDFREVMAYRASEEFAIGSDESHVYNWSATMVYDGMVYDNILYRLRGAYGRYRGNGKRNMRFRFNLGDYFRARDQNGDLYPQRWRTLTTSGGTEGVENPGVSGDITLTYGLNEALSYRLYNTVGVPAPETHFFHMRVIDDVNETDQFFGDFHGIHMALEDYDVRFLEAHDLERGNLYKLSAGTRDALQQQRYQGTNAVSDGSDHDNIEDDLTGFQSADYIRSHVNLDQYYRYRSVTEAIRHYDYFPDDNRNMAYYFEPDYQAENDNLGRLWVLPWDTDATWGPAWCCGDDVVSNSLFSMPPGPRGGDRGETTELWPGYFNAIREFRDLVWQPGQIEPLIDAFVSVLLPLESADRARWQGAPRAAGNYDGLEGAGIDSLDALARDLKDFAFQGGNWRNGPVGPGGRAAFLDDLQASHGEGAEIPATPALEYVGEAGFPVDGLRFRTDAFSDPQGDDTFAALQWRVAQVSQDEPQPGLLVVPPLEWNASWESDELIALVDPVRIPSSAVQVGNVYRVRARMKDSTGRWSHWSAPIEFTTSGALSNDLEKSLRISEIHYHPAAASVDEIRAGHDDADDFEFIELLNVGEQTLTLAGAQLQQVETENGQEGVTYDFGDSQVSQLEVGQRVVVVEDLAAFRFRYGDDALVAGEWTGKLSNGGETVTLLGHGEIIQQFRYDDNWQPTTDGLGASLEMIDPHSADLNLWARPAGWSASHILGGTPGSPRLLAGDSNRDGRFDSSDLVLVFQIGEYEDGIPRNSDFDEGDWNGDGDFSSSDLVLAFQFGHYETDAGLNKAKLAAAVDAALGQHCRWELPRHFFRDRPSSIADCCAAPTRFE